MSSENSLLPNDEEVNAIELPESKFQRHAVGYENDNLLHKVDENPPGYLQKFLNYLFSATIGLIVILSLAVISIISMALAGVFNVNQVSCGQNCQIYVVETIPNDLRLSFLPGVNTTFDVFYEMISNAKKSIQISAFYWNLNNSAVPAANGQFGRMILEAIYEAKNKNPSLTIEIIQNTATASFSQAESLRMQLLNVATVTNIDLPLTYNITGDNSNILASQHSKFLITDDSNFYLGSANMDWKSLSQVKELGIYVKDCPCYARDLQKVFQLWQYFGSELNMTIPMGFPPKFDTEYNQQNPLNIHFAQSNDTSQHFIAVNPPPLMAPGRTWELDSILSLLRQPSSSLTKESILKSSINISIMDYSTVVGASSATVMEEIKRGKEKSSMQNQFEYWPQIDDVLRAALFNNMEVNLLISKWNSSAPYFSNCLLNLLSLNDLCLQYHLCNGKINIKLFIMPDPVSFPPYPHTRVNHPKYFVMQDLVLVSTSNWAKDYFYKSMGVSLVTNHKGTRETVKNIFNRDWESQYAISLTQGNIKEILMETL